MAIIRLLYVLVMAYVIISDLTIDDYVFDPYKKSFEEITGKKIPSFLSVGFATRSEGIAGTCKFVPYSISVDPKVWFYVDSSTKTAIIYHELSHCVCLRLRHSEGELSDGCPESIMNATIPSEECLDKHWDYYMTEFCVDKSE